MSQSSPKGAGAALGGHVGRPASPWLRLLRASPLTPGARHTCEQLGSLGHGSCQLPAALCPPPSVTRLSGTSPGPAESGPTARCTSSRDTPRTRPAPLSCPASPSPRPPRRPPAHELPTRCHLRLRVADPARSLPYPRWFVGSTLVRRVGDVRMERPCRPGRRRSDTEEAAAGPGGHARGLRSCFLLTWLCSQLILFTDYLELFEI